MPLWRRARWVVRLVLCLLAVTLPAVAAADPLEVALQSMAARLSSVGAIKGKKVGMGQFRMRDGRLAEIGAYLADKLEVSLIRWAGVFGFEVVNRSHLCQVIRENGLWVKDQFDPALPKKLGNLQGVQLLVTGWITDLGTHADLVISAVSTESAVAPWGESVRIPLDPALRPLLNRSAVFGGCGETAAAAPASPDSLRVKLWTDRTEYRICDPIRFHLRTSRDAHITLIDIGTSGDVAILFPNRFHPNHFVRGGQVVTIPPTDAGFDFAVKEPPGFEQVRVIATEEPVKFHPDDFPGQRGAFRSLDPTESRVLTRDIKIQKAKAAPSRWAEDLVTLQIRPNGPRCKE